MEDTPGADGCITDSSLKDELGAGDGGLSKADSVGI